MSAVMFSVIVTVYNREKEITTALSSLLNQTYDNFEVIIVDDSSLDGSVNSIELFLERNPNFRATLVRRAENGGQNAAINSSAPFLKGEYVAFLDSDDQWEPGFLDEFNKHLGKLSGRAFGFHYCRLIDGPDWSLEGSNQFQNVLRQGYLSALGTLVIKLDAFKTVLPLPERFFVNDMCQDDFLSFELARNFAFSHLPKELYRINGYSNDRITLNNRNYIVGWLQFYEFYKEEIVAELGWRVYVKHLSRLFTDFLLRRDFKLWIEFYVKQSRSIGIFPYLYFTYFLFGSILSLVKSRMVPNLRVNS